MIVNRMRTVLGVGLLGLGTLGLGSAAVVGQNQAPAADPHQPLNLAAAPPAAAARPAPGGRAKPAEKIAAKGIDDDDVPYPAVPTQAVVRLEDGKLIVRQRQRGQVPMTRKFAGPDGEGVTSYQPGPSVRGQEHDAADVSVFDVQGNRVQPKVWKEKLKADQHVLVAFDGRLPHPRELTLFKDDTLIVVFPGDVVESRPAPAFPGAPFATPLFPGQPPSVPPPPGGPSAPAAARPRVAPPGVPAPPSPPVDDIPPLGLPATPDRR